MISAKTIIDKANAKITAGLSETEILQLSVIDDSITKSKLTVTTIGDLPDVVNNKGRMAYVSSQNSYYFSDGIEWLSDFSSILISASSTYAWGFNTYGRLGDNSTVDKSSPVTVVGGGISWGQVSAGDSHSLGVTNTGIAYAWGYGGVGRLGDNTTTSKSSPVTVVGNITNWSQVSAGDYHSLGLTNTGIAYAWGYGATGRLGDNSIVNKLSPVTVVGGITNWSQVSAGRAHSLGITDTGIAYAWGSNTFFGTPIGQLGDNTTINKSSPVTVAGGITNWSQVSAGNFHSLGLTNTGIAYAWGINTYGQLGDGSANLRSSPVTVVGGITNWSQVSAGNFHSLGLTNTGIAYAWGFGTDGRLGDNTTINKSSPITVTSGITNWSQVSAGYSHSLGLTNTGIAYAWGNNGDGRLGDGSTISRSSPVTVAGGITNWSEVNAGNFHSLGVESISKGFN
jgi:alpha-tubulin suppressor-like RCC1 family protein